MARGLNAHFQRYVQGLLDVASQYHLNARITSQGRSWESQRRLYNRRAENPYPVARPGCSWHQYGLAVDLISDNNAFLGKVWLSWGGQWSPSDAIHFGVFWDSAC